MNTTPNVHNFIDMLKYEHINKIASYDWTQEELHEFADFIRMFAEQYSAKAVLETYRLFVWADRDYSNTIAVATLDELEDPSSSWLDDAFMRCKLYAADMAAELVFDSGITFFGEAYR